MNLPSTGPDGWHFAVEHDWGCLPPGRRWGLTHAVASLPDGAVLILRDPAADDPWRDTVVELDAGGGFVRSFGAAYADGAHGLELGCEDGTTYLYLTSQRLGLCKLDLTGTEIWRFAKPELYRVQWGLRWSPSNCAIAPDGRIYLADGYGSAFIAVLDRDGRELGLIGGPGSGPQHLWHPHGLAVDTRGPVPLLAVADNLHPGLHYLSLDGAHVGKSPCGLRDPRHVRIWGRNLLIPDLCGVVTVLGPDNAVLAHLGDAGLPLADLFPMRERAPGALPHGTFVHPHDACPLGDDLLVVEWLTHGRITRLHRLP